MKSILFDDFFTKAASFTHRSNHLLSFITFQPLCHQSSAPWLKDGDDLQTESSLVSLTALKRPNVQHNNS